jgi:hypothetical protein
MPDLVKISAESLLAVTGIFPTDKHPTVNDIIASNVLLETWRAKLKRWLYAPLKDDYQVKEFEFIEPPKEEALEKKLLYPIPEETSVAWIQAIGDMEIATDYLLLIKRAREYLYEQWPKLPEPGVAVGVFPLSDEELCDVWEMVRIVDNPENLFDEINAQSISIPQIEAWRSCYQELSTEFDKILDELVIDFTAKGNELTWQQQDIFRMLRGVPLDAIVRIEISPQAKQAVNQTGT